MTEWKEMTTADAKIQLSKWDAMSHDEFDSLMNNFHPAVNSEFYCSIREHLISKWHELNQSNNNSKYYIDLHFGKELFSLLNSPKYSLTPRIASNDQIWIYLSIEVIPDIIASRYRKEDADSSTDEDSPAVIKKFSDLSKGNEIVENANINAADTATVFLYIFTRSRFDF